MITHLKSGRAGAELSANQINPWGLKNRIATISAEVHFKAQKESLVNREGYTAESRFSDCKYSEYSWFSEGIPADHFITVT